MHTTDSLIQQLEEMGIDRNGTVIVHSSMKSIGDVEDGADTVLDALSAFMAKGLLVFPTHTWQYINKDNPKFYVESSPSHIGILTEKFRKRPKVIRSLHPTHSVAALGEDALTFTADNENFDTPCARESSWGKLLDREAKILLIGVDLRRNTFIHGVEEWLGIPNRVTDAYEQLFTVLSNGMEISVPSRRHYGLDWSAHYWKVEGILAKKGTIQYGEFGDATVLVCDTVKLTRYITEMLTINPELFSDNEPLAEVLI
ncbi:AAC(3) family N-acetyltransferase [Sporosarcina sp. ANT_H38]|uniref:AAC(3) family N-acetyltransferase n=1 Tax=Sporosarcina sp. ANT_H38 TaxID=2597358 RepID=UPI0011F1E4D6|nr:AAC(3) family N-acetyltransferase [Sporosarcina sp. ANT_H38]KAA0965606.1 AAC(3) family N-acetyltransferase [Sporosarcina sp. ANT_H38]